MENTSVECENNNSSCSISNRNIDEALPGDVFMINPSVMELNEIPWNFIVIIRVEGDDLVVQRVDPVTDKTQKGFSTKKRLRLDTSNTTFIKSARTFEERNKYFQDKYPFQGCQNQRNILFQVPFSKAQMRDYPNLDSYCGERPRIDCLFNVLAALRLRSIPQCNKDALECNSNAQYGVHFDEAIKYLSKISGQRIKLLGGFNVLFKDIEPELNGSLCNNHGTIIFIKFKTDTGDIRGHYTIIFKENEQIYYYDPQSGSFKRYQDALPIILFAVLFIHDMDRGAVTMSEAEADSQVITRIGGIIKRQKRSNKRRKRFVKKTRRHVKSRRKHNISKSK
jgi:hypothetical protein